MITGLKEVYNAPWVFVAKGSSTCRAFKCFCRKRLVRDCHNAFSLKIVRNDTWSLWVLAQKETESALVLQQIIELASLVSSGFLHIVAARLFILLSLGFTPSDKSMSLLPKYELCSTCMGCEPDFKNVKIPGRSKERIGRELLEGFYIKKLGDKCGEDTCVALYIAESSFSRSFFHWCEVFSPCVSSSFLPTFFSAFLRRVLNLHTFTSTKRIKPVDSLRSFRLRFFLCSSDCMR